MLGDITEFNGLNAEHQSFLARKKFFDAIEAFLVSFVRYMIEHKRKDSSVIDEWIYATAAGLKCTALSKNVNKLLKSATAVALGSVLREETAESEVQNLGHNEIIDIAAELMALSPDNLQVLEYIRISTSNLGVDGFDLVIEKLQLVESLTPSAEKNEREPQPDRPAKVKVFDFDMVRAAKSDAQNRGRLEDNLGLILKTESEYRELSRVDNGIAQQVQALAENFPNFASTIEYVVEQIALSSLTDDRAFAMQPILLTGPPGVGKTAFVKALAEVIGVQFKTVDMASMTSGFVIGGSSSKWAEGSEGVVLNVIRTGQYANPIVLLDEIDKVSENMQHDPLGPLYSLLEPVSARAFVDEAVGVQMDASNIVWIATANNIDDIPKPILSRFFVMHVDKATGQDARKVVQSVWSSVLSQSKWGHNFGHALSEDVVALLAEEAPRDMKRLMLMACGHVALMRPPVNGELLELTVFDINSKSAEKTINMQIH